MNKAIENLVELGVNLLIAVAVLAILISVMTMGRENVVAIEQADRAAKQAEQSATYGGLNGTTVTYGRVIELVTCNAGKLDIYVDSTVNGGAILISKDLWKGACDWSTASKPIGFTVDTAKRIGSTSTSDYMSVDKYLDAQVQKLLAADLSAMFATGEWTVYVAVNNEWVGKAAGTEPNAANLVTGLRFVRTK